METAGTGWKQSWVGSGPHINAVTKKPYRGINQAVLSLFGSGAQIHATYKQWGEAGAQVCKGQKATTIFFFKPYNIRDRDTDEEKQIYIARTYSVFGINQVENPPDIKLIERPDIERHAECDRIILETGANITWQGDKAAYIPSQDRIVMPSPKQFESPEAMYSVAFHELGHWSGAENRLNRDLKGRFGDDKYAFEELIGECTAAFVCTSVGIIPEPRKESAQYLNSWMRVLKNDKRAIVSAFSYAQRAADFIMKHDPSRPDFSADQPAATRDVS